MVRNGQGSIHEYNQHLILTEAKLGLGKKTCRYFYNGKVHVVPCKGRRIPSYPREDPSPQTTQATEGGFQPCKTTDRLPGICRPPAYCFYQYDNPKEYQKNMCDYKPDLRGICCPTTQYRQLIYKESESRSKLFKLFLIELFVAGVHIPKPLVLEAEVPYLPYETLREAAEEANRVIRLNFKLEEALIRNGTFQKPQTMEAYHQSFFGKPDAEERELTKRGLIMLETSSRVAVKLQLDRRQARDGLPKYSLRGTELEDLCIREPRCNPDDFYRTADGSCNNLKYPLWGRSDTPMTRLLPPAYSDGVNEFRKAGSEDDLPAARQVSLLTALDKNLPQRRFNLIVMQWGQFLDHDLTLALSTTLDTEEAEGILCCPDNPTQDQRRTLPLHPACSPIPVGRQDPFYARFGTVCINFIRNAPAPRPDCNLGPREQLNQLTHYLDGSMVYGSTRERAADLRAFRDGE